MVLGLAFCHWPPCGWDSWLLLMNGSGGWGIVTFPVVHFQESQELGTLSSSLKSFISFVCLFVLCCFCFFVCLFLHRLTASNI